MMRLFVVLSLFLFVIISLVAGCAGILDPEIANPPEEIAEDVTTNVVSNEIDVDVNRVIKGEIEVIEESSQTIDIGLAQIELQIEMGINSNLSEEEVAKYRTAIERIRVSLRSLGRRDLSSSHVLVQEEKGKADIWRNGLVESTLYYDRVSYEIIDTDRYQKVNREVIFASEWESVGSSDSLSVENPESYSLSSLRFYEGQAFLDHFSTFRVVDNPSTYSTVVEVLRNNIEGELTIKYPPHYTARQGVMRVLSFWGGITSGRIALIDGHVRDSVTVGKEQVQSLPIIFSNNNLTLKFHTEDSIDYDYNDSFIDLVIGKSVDVDIVSNSYRVDLSYANLSGADLANTNLSNAYLRGVILSGADLSGADLSGSDLLGADLSGANLSNAYLRGADLSDANLSGADLSGADLSDANLSRANLIGTILIGANLAGIDLTRLDIYRAIFIATTTANLPASGITLPVDIADAVLISSFEDPRFMLSNGWTATGGFANPGSLDAWRGSSGVVKVGDRAVSTCNSGGLNCSYSRDGTLTSPNFRVNRRYLNLLVSGTYNATSIYIAITNVTDGGAEVTRITPNASKPSYINGDNHWRSVDVSGLFGDEIKVIISDQGNGFISFDHFFLSDSPWGFFSPFENYLTSFDGSAFANGSNVLPPGSYDLSKGGDRLLGVIFDFDDHRELTTANGWSREGAFAANPNTANRFNGLDNARIGANRISSCLGTPSYGYGQSLCFYSTAKLTSPVFQLSNRYLNFLMLGGSSSGIGSQTSIEFRIFAAEADARYRNNALLRFAPESGLDLSAAGGWHSIDVGDYIASGRRFIRIQLDDANYSAAVTFDHLYQSDTAGGVVRGILEAPTTTANLPPAGVSLPSDIADAVLITSFEDPVSMVTGGWIATGVFGDSVSADAWRGASTGAGAARVGDRAVSTCQLGGGDCDNSDGMLISPNIRVRKRYLNLLVAGDYNPENIYITVTNVTDGGDEVAKIIPANPGDNTPFIQNDLHWHSVDLGHLIRDQIKIIISDRGRGFISFDHFFFSDTPWGFFKNQNQLYSDFNDSQHFRGGASILPSGSYDLSAGGLVGVIFDFDDHRLMTTEAGWTFTGDFGTGTPNSSDALEGIDNSSIGANKISTCELGSSDCNSPTGTITSPAFQMTKRYLNFLMIGSGSRGVSVTNDGIATFQPDLELRVFAADSDTSNPSNALLRFNPASLGFDLYHADGWHSLDANIYRNKSIRIQLVDNTTSASFTFDHLYQSDVAAGEVRAVLPTPLLSPQSQTEILTGTYDSSYFVDVELTAKSYSPINSWFTNEQLHVVNFTPSNLINLRVKDPSGTIISRFNIPAWTKLVFNDPGGTNVEVPETNNPIMTKFKQIITRLSWRPYNLHRHFINADWVDDYWATSVTGEQLRRFYIMNYNMAYYLSSDSFVQVMTTNAINDLEGYSSPMAVVNAMRNQPRTLNLWGIVNFLGLCGGNNFGIANFILFNTYFSRSFWVCNSCYAGTHVWFHELAHVFGFSHGSNLTYFIPGYPTIPYIIDEVLRRKYNNGEDIFVFPPF